MDTMKVGEVYADSHGKEFIITGVGTNDWIDWKETYYEYVPLSQYLPWDPDVFTDKWEWKQFNKHYELYGTVRKGSFLDWVKIA